MYYLKEQAGHEPAQTQTRVRSMLKETLLTPGPTPVPQNTTLKMAESFPHHRTTDFSALLHDTLHLLHYIYQTTNDLFILTSSGTGAMETALVNTLSPNDTVLVIRAGKFGERWGKLCEAYGFLPEYIDVPWGHALNLSEVQDRLTPRRHKALLCQHCETSTGTLYDIQKIAQLTERTDTLIIVDAISGLGVHPCCTDEWGLDVVVCGSQKALMTPPGLSCLSFSNKAWAAYAKSNTPKFYFDLQAEKKALLKNTTAWTPAITLIKGLHHSLTQLKDEGLHHIHQRHKLVAQAVREGVNALGLKLYSQSPCNALTAVHLPKGIQEESLIRGMSAYKVQIAGGQGQAKGKLFRIGHLGHVSISDILTAFHALEFVLQDLGHKIELGSSFKAIQHSLRTHTTQSNA